MQNDENLSPETVHAEWLAGRVLLVDVREVAEFAAERIHGALLYPLSTFDPAALPTDGSRQLVFQCGSGKRSRAALDRYKLATGRDAAHLAGGIAGWKGAGQSVLRLDPTTGQVIDPGVR